MSIVALPSSGLGWDFRQCPNGPIPSAIGGYEHSGIQYLFLLQGSEFTVGDFNLHALMSTNLGVTWTDTGSIFIPNSAGTGQALPTYTTCMDGNTIYVMGVNIDGTGLTTADATAGPILLYNYSLTTNSFVSTTGVTPSGAPTVWKAWFATDYAPRSQVCIHLIRRGAGDMLLVYSGIENISTNKYQRVFVTTFNGTTCGGTGSMLPGQAGAADRFKENCACMDASSILHVIFSGATTSSWFHVGMNSTGTFGSAQTIETNVYFFSDTSNLLDFAGPSDTIAFLGVRNRSSPNDNGDLAIYTAPGGSLTPTWAFNNILPSTPPNVVPDAVIAPDWLAAIGFVGATLHAYWTQNGLPPNWRVSEKTGSVRTSTALPSNLNAWTPEVALMGPFDTATLHWGASQVSVWSGPSIGLGIIGNFEGFDDAGTGDPIESSYFTIASGNVSGPIASPGTAIGIGSGQKGFALI